MKAVILAGGLGTRLRPVVSDLPKAMAPINGQPFLSYQLALLRRQGVVDIVLAVGCGWQRIADCLGSGQAWGVRLTYSIEEVPLGTAGAVRQAATLFADEDFLVLNGDTYFDASLDSLWRAHATSSALATIAVTPVPDAGRFGAVLLDNESRVVSFLEKGSQSAGLINAGVYVFRRPLLQRIPAQGMCSLEQDIFPALAREGQLAGCVLEGFHLDIGTPQSFEQAQASLPRRIDL